MNHDHINQSSDSFYAKTACGATISSLENFASAVCRGERVYFCTLACLKVFEENPDPFMAGEIEHPIDSIK